MEWTKIFKSNNFLKSALGSRASHNDDSGHQQQDCSDYAPNGTEQGGIVPPAAARKVSISRSGRYKSKSKQRARLLNGDETGVMAPPFGTRSASESGGTIGADAATKGPYSHPTPCPRSLSHPAVSTSAAGPTNEQKTTERTAQERQVTARSSSVVQPPADDALRNANVADSSEETCLSETSPPLSVAFESTDL